MKCANTDCFFRTDDGKCIDKNKPLVCIDYREELGFKEEARLKLLVVFKGSFFNDRDEFIAHRYSNTYFMFGNCADKEDVNCKVLEWFSRPASKGIPYKAEWRNKKFRQFMLDGINAFLGTMFTFEDMDIIYTYLGNACHHELTKEFVDAGYDMSVLTEYAKSKKKESL